MNTTSLTHLTPRDVILLLAQHRRWWITTTMVFALAAAVFAWLRPEVWSASQALVIRLEADAADALGSYDRAAERKSTQETLVELARSRQVLQGALEDVGPPSELGARARQSWPTVLDTQGLLESVKFLPPKGAEFGTTQMFYLQVRHTDRERAKQLAQALCANLREAYQQLRGETARGVVTELQRKVELADGDLQNVTANLASFEKRYGADLAELRILTSHVTGTSDLRESMLSIENELRRAESDRLRLTELKELLAKAAQDPHHLVATPNTLLESLPALRNLKEGLITAQMQTAAIRGRVTEAHPRYQTAIDAESEAKRYLLRELEASMLGVRTELKINGEQIAALKSRLDNAKHRQERIASLRAQYANLLAAAESRTARLEECRRELATAQAKEAGAAATSPIHAISTPDTGLRPIGPSLSKLVTAGGAGGLLIGLGLVFLAVPASVPAEATEARPANHQPARPLGTRDAGLSRDFSVLNLRNAFRAWSKVKVGV